MTEDEFSIPLILPDETVVYRQVHIQDLEKSKRYPKAKHFKADPDGLSVHWAAYIAVNEIYHIIGISYRKDTTQFKSPGAFKVFALPVIFLRNIEGISDVEHTPLFIGNPAPVGYPNNYAHASVLYGDDEEVRLKLSDYCNENFSESFCDIDLEVIDKEIAELREREDNTPYHRLDP